MSRSDAALPRWACANCGFWQPYFERPPSCPVCLDYRHPLPPAGWRFFSEAEAAGQFETSWREVLPDVWAFETAPALGIGPLGWLVRTGHGNVHWEGAGWTSDAALDKMEALGGVRFLSGSHAHVYGSWWRAAERFGPEVVVQSESLPFAQALSVSWPFGESASLAPGLTLHHTGGHTPGHSVLLWAERRLLFCGDAFKFRLGEAGRATHVSTHKAYDAHVPLSHDDVRLYRDLFAALDFDGVVTPWEAVPAGGKAAVLHLLDRLLDGRRPSADWHAIPGGPLAAPASGAAERAERVEGEL